MMGDAVLLGKSVTARPQYRLVEFASQSAPGCFTPGLLAGGTSFVEGELYAMDDAHLAALDAFEEEGIEYKRVELALSCGRAAWSYLYIGSRKLIEAPRFIAFDVAARTSRWLSEDEAREPKAA